MFGSSRGTGRIVVVYVALTLVWGASFLFLKVALEAVSPLALVLVRLLLAAGTLGVIMVATRRAWPRDRGLWGHQAVVAALLCVVPYLVVAWGAQFVGTGLAGIITAATPMTTVLFSALLLPADRLGRPGIVGLVLGAVGVVVIVGGDGLTGSVAGMLACLAGPVCYGAGYAYQRRFVSARGLDGVTEASMQMVLAAGMVGVVTPFLLGSPLAAGGHGPLTVTVVLALGTLGVVSTGLGYVGNAVVMQAWGAQRTASITYLMPVVAVTLGVLFLGEHLEWMSVAGGLVVVIGVLVGRVPTPTEALEAEVVQEAEALLSASVDALESATASLDLAVAGCATETVEAAVRDEVERTGAVPLADATTSAALNPLDAVVPLAALEDLEAVPDLDPLADVDPALGLVAVAESGHLDEVLDAVVDTLASATMDCAGRSLEAVVLEHAVEVVEAARECAGEPAASMPAVEASTPGPRGERVSERDVPHPEAEVVAPCGADNLPAAEATRGEYLAV